MRKIILAFLCVCFITQLQAQTSVVTAKGTGLKREDALQDALRAAVSQAAGVALMSETKVENFMVISDAISTNTRGYISKYDVVKEVPFSDRFEVTVNATVSTEPIKADFQLLAKSVGGIRFLVMYDPRTVKKEEQANYDYAVEKINAQLSSKRYRYIEKSRFDQLRREAMNIMQEGDTSGISYVQQLGIMADAQFIIQVSGINANSRSEAFDTRTSSRVSIVTKAYDNCTAEGLGTISLNSEWKSSRDAGDGLRAGIDDAVQRSVDNLLLTFTGYVGDWVNNGTPFELRFYQTGSFRDFRDLREKLKADPAFGGQLEITSVNNYTKLNCTFKKKADDLADKVLDLSDQIPAFHAKRLDVKLIYGRQISFAPTGVAVPELSNTKSSTTESPRQEQTKPATSTKSTNTKTKTPTNKKVSTQPKKKP
jgi:hypothetical protein